jgi:hypothetical protein
MNTEDQKGQEAFEYHGYTAFEKWEYKPIIYDVHHSLGWVDFTESFYRASSALVRTDEPRVFYTDIEGVAAIFLFRHYLELALKRIIVRGRWLVSPSVNAAREDVKQVASIHHLQKLWEGVLKDAKPKIDPKDWDGYDISFVESCIAEFHQRDEKGFAFRYPMQGGEYYQYDFGWFRQAMEHVQQILSNITTYLTELHGQNAEWQEIVNQEIDY